ncbi:hypothetical protein [Streptomyces sp. 1331.2]|uniref:hypothetical protein n=1 Tax=Streptomyces sp. 1331.2 TaxID=1938835 RepID=UPI000BC388B6|nr:hypothetical protein [Streptomyces sp. 1331.2]SOB82118.1 hypothetical protein SAMN06272789_2274 [Streptomyces sp. 1331.2]
MLQPEPPSFDTPPPGPVVTATPEPQPEPKRKGGVSWKVLLTVALVMAVGGTAGGVALMKKLDDGKTKDSKAAGPVTTAQSPSPTPTSQKTASADSGPTGSSGDSVTAAPSKSGQSAVSAPARPTGYTPILDKKSLSIPGAEYTSDTYRIDLNAGTVVPHSGELKWGLGVSNNGSGSKANAFDSYGDDKSDFAVITEPTVTAEQCAAAIDSRPDTDLSYNRVAPGRLLCIRDRVTRNIAVAVIEQADPTTGAAKVTVSTWRAS